MIFVKKENYSFGRREEVENRGKDDVNSVTLNKLKSNTMTGKPLLDIEFDQYQMNEEGIGKRNPGSTGLLSYFCSFSTDEIGAEIDVSFVEKLLQAGADVNITDCHGQTVLHEVAKNWSTDVADFLIKRGASVNQRDRYGRTPLHTAANFDYSSMVKILVESGGNLEEKTKGDLQTPLHLACKKDSVNAVKVLLRLGANINTRDHIGRTPLCVAADWRSTQVVKYMLEYGAPAGAFNDYGSLPLSSMINKMPEMAMEALNQFTSSDTAFSQRTYYLHTLDACEAKTIHRVNTKNILQLIVLYEQADLVNTSAIKKLIDVKWKLFGFKHAIFSLVLNITYSILWTVIGFNTPQDWKYLISIKHNLLNVIIELILVLMTIYLIFKQTRNMALNQKVFLAWKRTQLRKLEAESCYCHPRYKDECLFLTSEINSVQKINKFGIFSNMWTWIECFFLVAVAALICCKTAYEIMQRRKVNEEILEATKLYHNVVFIFLLFAVWIRLLKELRSISFLSPFILLLGPVAKESIKFFLLFLDILVPYVCVFFMFFGGDVNKPTMVKSGASGHEFTTIPGTFMTVWSITLVADFPYEGLVAINEYMAQIIVGSYWAVVSLICVNLYIALMTETFSRVYSNAKANSILQLATVITEIEQSLSDNMKAKFKKYFSKHCNPLEVFDPGHKTGTVDAVKEGLSNLTRDVKKLKDRFMGRLQNAARVLEENERQLQTVKENLVKATAKLELLTEMQNQMRLRTGLRTLRKVQDVVKWKN